MIFLLNILVPGAGLICLRREWLGFTLSLVFAICGNITTAGLLIAPLAFPKVMVVIAAMLTFFSWVLAQILCWLQARSIRARAQGLALESQAETSPTAPASAILRL